MFYDRNDPEDLEDFVEVLFKICGLVFIISSTIGMTLAIFGNSGPPPEPQWWLDFEKLIGVTW